MEKNAKPMKIYPVKLLKKVQDAPTTYSFYFNKPEDLEWPEGGHTHLALDRFDETIGRIQKKDVRHFSIASLCDENVIQMTTRIRELRSDYKCALLEAKEGDTFHLFKIGGRMGLRRMDVPLVFLSAGVGLATFRPLVRSYAKDSSGIPEIVSLNVDSSQEDLFKSEFEEYQKQVPKFTFTYFPSRDTYKEAVDKLLSDEKYKNAIFYIIGSDSFLEDHAKRLCDAGIGFEQLLFDKKDDFYEKVQEMWKK